MPRKSSKNDDQVKVIETELKVESPKKIEKVPEIEAPVLPATQIVSSSEEQKEQVEKKPEVPTRSRVEMVKAEAKPVVAAAPNPTPVNMNPVHKPMNFGQNRRPMPAVAKVAVAPEQVEVIKGVLEIMSDGSGYVRPRFNPSNRDAYIAFGQVKRIGLRAGDMIEGEFRLAREGEKNNMMVRIDKVNGMDVNSIGNRPFFNDLVPIYAQKQVKLETDPEIMSTRIIDLFSPIGFGQRGMIVSPPKAGKTTLLKEIAAGVAINYPNVHLMAVLVGERPEEVTDMQRFVKGEVIASSFDQKPEEQTRAAEIAIERAKRLVEMGKDVFVVFDSITRLARAYNLAIPTSGRTLSGGFDPAALYPSKKFFGAARNIENGGSLTIIGTALVETGSKLDDLVFEEFKGTGNMELRLTRSLAERRIWPAFDILKSGTRREDLLLEPDILNKMNVVRRMFDNIEDKEEATIMVMEQMKKTKVNSEFMKKIGR